MLCRLLNFQFIQANPGAGAAAPAASTVRIAL
jgi:hypothetical protein